MNNWISLNKPLIGVVAAVLGYISGSMGIDQVVAPVTAYISIILGL